MFASVGCVVMRDILQVIEVRLEKVRLVYSTVFASEFDATFTHVSTSQIPSPQASLICVETQKLRFVLSPAAEFENTHLFCLLF